MCNYNPIVESVASGEHKLQQVKAQLTQMRKDVQQMGNIVATSKRATVSLLFHTICLRRMLVMPSHDCNRFQTSAEYHTSLCCVCSEYNAYMAERDDYVTALRVEQENALVGSFS